MPTSNIYIYIYALVKLCKSEQLCVLLTSSLKHIHHFCFSALALVR